MNILSAPGLLFQKITTKEPDEEMIEVAIKSVEAVFDWRAFLKENFEVEEEPEETPDYEEPYEYEENVQSEEP